MSSASRAPSYSPETPVDLTSLEKKRAQSLSDCCSWVTVVALLVISSLAWAGILSGFQAGIINLSCIAVMTACRLNYMLRFPANNDAEATKRVKEMAITVIEGVAGAIFSSLAVAGVIPGVIFGQTFLGFVGLQVLERCGQIT